MASPELMDTEPTAEELAAALEQLERELGSEALGSVVE